MFCGLGKKQLEIEGEVDGISESTNKHAPKRSKKRRKSRSQEEEIASSEVERSRLRAELEELRATLSHKNNELEKLTNQVLIVFNENGDLGRRNRELQENNRVLTQLLGNLETSYEECSIQMDSYQEQVKQLTRSETSLQIRLAEKEEVIANLQKQTKRLKKSLTTLEDQVVNSSSMKKMIGYQEKLVVEKTKQVLALESSIKAMAGGLEVQLNSLQYVSDSVVSNNQDLKQCLTGTIDKLYHSLEKSSKQTWEKLDALKNAWDSFRQQDTQLDSAMHGDADLVKRNIPVWLKRVSQRLSYTLGPNWLDAGRVLGLDGDELEKICVVWGQYGMQELALRVMDAWCDKSPETQLNQAVLQTAMSQLEINPLLLEPMSDHDQGILVEKYQKLVDGMMDVPLIEGYFRQEGVLSASAVSYILDPSTRYGRIRRLLKVLRFSGSRALPVFRDALLKSKQQHLAMELTGEHGLSADGGSDRDITLDLLDEHLENQQSQNQMKMDTLAELQTFLLRVSAETKKEVLLVREHMEKGIFKNEAMEMERKMPRAPSCDVKWSVTM